MEGAPAAVARLRDALRSRGIELVYCADGTAAREFLLSRLPAGATVMNGGSKTLEQIGLLDALAKGPYRWLRPAIRDIEEGEARVRARRQAGTADYFFGGVNAITATGEIVNADGSGTRVAAYAYSAGKVFLVAGTNKLVADIAAAFDRLRNQAAVQECRRLDADTPCAITGKCDNDACRGPGRQCGKVLVIENEKIPGRMCVVMIGAAFGY